MKPWTLCCHCSDVWRHGQDIMDTQRMRAERYQHADFLHGAELPELHLLVLAPAHHKVSVLRHRLRAARTPRVSTRHRSARASTDLRGHYQRRHALQVPCDTMACHVSFSRQKHVNTRAANLQRSLFPRSCPDCPRP
eukprot:1733099-Rhodomonas_salina.1